MGGNKAAGEPLRGCGGTPENETGNEAGNEAGGEPLRMGLGMRLGGGEPLRMRLGTRLGGTPENERGWQQTILVWLSLYGHTGTDNNQRW